MEEYRNMIKVVKFGGSSLADGRQFQKAGKIIEKDRARRYVVPSAPGKRAPDDTKVTDMLYTCYAQALLEEEDTQDSFEVLLQKIRERYDAIIRDLGLGLSVDEEFHSIRENFTKKIGRDYAASRGEY